jgi:hypothetical protein
MAKPTMRRKDTMTLAEKRAFNQRLLTEPKVQSMIRDSLAASARGEGTRWEDLKRSRGGH